jgi:hypothetical protein
MSELPSHVLGLDLGQSQDPSALASTLREPVRDPAVGPREFRRYTVDGLRRWELNTPYPAVVEDVCKLSEHPSLSGCPLVVDATGVGKAVVDMFRLAKREGRLRCHIVAASIIGMHAVGGSVARSGPSPTGGWTVVKKDLVGVMQTIVQYDRLTIDPRLPLAPVLGRELQAFRVKTKVGTGNETFEAWREREHDDIVFAVALACYWGERAFRRFNLWMP